jgi:oligogalacturonide transport system substrate-binding protein
VSENVSRRGSEFDRTEFKNQTMAGVITWGSDSSYYETTAAENGFEIQIGDYITYSESSIFGWYAKPAALYAIKKSTTEPEAAAELMEFMLNSAEMTSIQGSSRGFPESRSAAETMEARGMLYGIEYQAAQKRLSSEQMGIMSPYVENNTLISIFTEACDSVYYEKSDISTAAKKAAEDMQAAMTS